VFRELAGLSRKKEAISRYDDAQKNLKQAINIQAWDGGWFLRAFTDSGRRVGSHKNKTGRIFLNPNTWAVICGAAGREQEIKAMEAVHEHLFTDYGLMLLSPAFREPDPELGAVTLYPPSLKENGGIFSHTNPWAVMAEAMLGRGDRAFAYYQTQAPLQRNSRAETCKVEPYVYTQFLAGNEHQLPGEGRNSWLTGAASWNYVAATQYILGIRPEYEGLVIDPCVPQSWNGFEVIRIFRGVTYMITVKNPDHVCKGIRTMSVDGKQIDGNALPVLGDGKTHDVDVVMG
jgi:cellobiose phosphorylase